MPTARAITRIAGRHAGWLALAAAAPVAAALWPDTARTALRFAAESLLAMAPVIAAAVLVSAVVRASGMDGLLGRALGARGLSAILGAAAIGAVTPICGVGVLPIVASLLAAGVPLAPVMAFWLASPVTDPGMLAVTAGTLGPAFAVAKTVAAAAIGVLGGAATALAVRRGAFARPLRPGDRATTAGADAACGHAPKLAFWREAGRRALFRRDAADAATLILKWLSVAFLLEGVVRQVLPAEVVGDIVGRDNAWAIPLAVGLGAPIYLDGYAALPLVRGLIDMGMSQGAAMAFLVAGGVTSLYASLAVAALVRWPVFVWYLGLAVVAALAAGYGWQALAGLLP